MDVYEPGPGPQLHDLNPSPAPPLGLFWTVAIPDYSVDVNLGRGRATLSARDVAILDFGSIANAFDINARPVRGYVSFTVQWSGADERVKVRNADPIYGGFAGIDL